MIIDSAAENSPASYVAPSPPLSRRNTTSHDSKASAGSNGIADTDPAAPLLEQGRAALAAGSPQTAIGYFHRAAATKPDNPQIPVSAAAIALRADSPHVAVELLTPAAKQFPRSAAVQRMLGAAYYRTGDYKSSQVALQQALSLDNSSALSYLLLGCALAKLGQQEAAEENFRQAGMLDPRYKTLR